MGPEVGSSGLDGGADPFIGQVVANYQVLRRIGQGGMGAVYLGQHTVLARQAAIKVLLPEFSNNRDLVGRFLNEARATAQLRHAGFVEIFDSGALPDGSGYLVMEYLRGANLAAAIDWRRTFSPSEALAVLREVAVSVAHAHKHGIVHRDLKPDNVFLALEEDDEGGDRVVVKVLDFGIAKLTGGSGRDGSRTRTGSLLGTPLYMSPEQCRGAGQVDHRTDIYALGCIGYQALTGRPPFSYEGFGEIIAAHLGETPVPPSARVASVPEGVNRFVLSLMEKDPGKRPQTMTAVVAAITELQRTEAPAATNWKALIPPADLPRPATGTGAPPSSRASGAPVAEGWPATPPPSVPRTPSATSSARPTDMGFTVPPSISTLAGAASELGSLRDSGRVEPGRARVLRNRIIAGALGGIGLVVALFMILSGSGTHPVDRRAERRSARQPAENQEPEPAPDRAEGTPPTSVGPAPTAAPIERPAGPRVGIDDAPAAARPARDPAPPAVPATVTVKILSVPSDAVVLDAKGRIIGQTPLERALPRSDDDVGLMVRKSGYYPQRLVIDASRNTEVTVTLDKRMEAPPTTPGSEDDDRRKL